MTLVYTCPQDVNVFEKFGSQGIQIIRGQQIGHSPGGAVLYNIKLIHSLQK